MALETPSEAASDSNCSASASIRGASVGSTLARAFLEPGFSSNWSASSKDANS